MSNDKKRIFEDVPFADREAKIKEHAHHTEKRDMKRIYSEVELDEFRAYAVAAEIEKKNIEEDIEEKTMEHIAPLKAQKKIQEEHFQDNINKVRKGYEIVEEKLYAFPDYANDQMLFYNEDGLLRDTRLLLPNENQTKIIDLQQKQA